MLYPTQLAYYEDTYNTSLETEIIGIDVNDKHTNIFLDATIFYPFGGGQPSDQGYITTETGKAEVKNVQYKDGVVRHECVVIEGEVEEGQTATLILDWERRYKNMRVHSAGHIIHDILTKDYPIIPIKGDHGSKPYLEYKCESDLPSTLQTDLQAQVNTIISEGRSVVTRETDLDELKKIARVVPPNLPRGKTLRIIQIDGFPAMPDGGTQVRNIKEIGEVEITGINFNKNILTVKYGLK